MSNVDKREKVLKVENLKKYFYSGVGKKRLVVPAVDGISFDIYKREVLGLVGESGCGKTTTGRTLIKIYNPTDGNVVFNDVDIAAGFQSNLDNIQKIKRQLKNDIRLLRPNGEKIIALENKTKRTVLELKHDLADLKERYNEEFKKIDEPIMLYNKAKYDTKNEHTLRVEEAEYEINEKRKELLKLTLNNSKIEYEKELAMAKLSFERSFDGLKNSAALHKDEIAKRVEELKNIHQETVSNLENKYAPLILKDEETKKTKSDIHSDLIELKAQLKEAKAKEKEIYKENLSKIARPDYEQIKNAKDNLKSKYKLARQEKLASIKKIKKETKEETAKLSREIKLTKEETIALKEKIKELKLQSKKDILLQKEEIKKNKQINRSSESIEEITKMQMIFQDPISSLNPRMTVREIVSEGLVIQGKLSKKEIDLRVEESLELVGLSPEFAARYPHEFSGGQRQRIGVARALIMEPDLIIADEPVSALDVSIRAQVINLLTELKDELGLTILFIAHDLSIVEFFCDRIAVMYYGKIVELATSEDLFKNPMHPYTQSLLSAVPQPDPDYEKGRKRIFYDPRMHDYRFEKPKFRKIGEDHYVLASDKEFEKMQKEYKSIS